MDSSSSLSDKNIDFSVNLSQEPKQKVTKESDETKNDNNIKLLIA